AYTDMGTCQMALKQFREAEQTYQKGLDYLPATLGVADEEKAAALHSVGVARMGQQRWKDAEEPLLEAISIYDREIPLAYELEKESVEKAFSAKYRESQDRILNILAVDYFRQQRSGEALDLFERAYQQAVKFHASVAIVKQIVDNGKSVAKASGDTVAFATW